MIIWTPTVLSVLYACVLNFCICTCSVQLSMFHMERRSRNMLIIITIIIISVWLTVCVVCTAKHRQKPGGPVRAGRGNGAGQPGGQIPAWYGHLWSLQIVHVGGNCYCTFWSVSVPSLWLSLSEYLCVCLYVCLHFSLLSLFLAVCLSLFECLWLSLSRIYACTKACVMVLPRSYSMSINEYKFWLSAYSLTFQRM